MNGEAFEAKEKAGLMFQYRVTKYDPARRDAAGAYTLDEWTSFSDVGRTFSTGTLSSAEYQRIEDAYVAAARAFLQEAGVASLTVVGLENPRGVALPFAEGAELSAEAAGAILPRLLREEFWCRLESDVGFVHVGYDYAMYLGVAQPCPAAEALAYRLGLFMEPLPSPYIASGG